MAVGVAPILRLACDGESPNWALGCGGPCAAGGAKPQADIDAACGFAIRDAHEAVSQNFPTLPNKIDATLPVSLIGVVPVAANVPLKGRDRITAIDRTVRF